VVSSFFLSFFPRLFSAANLECRSETCCTRLAENAVGLYLRQSEKQLVKQQYVLHMSSQYGELQPTSGWDRFGCLGTPANFNWFCVLASLLQRRHSTEANQTLHDVWPSPGLVHYIYIFGILSGAKFTLPPSLALSYIGSVIARHSSSGCESNFAALSRGRHLYSAGRPSRCLVIQVHCAFVTWAISFYIRPLHAN